MPAAIDLIWTGARDRGLTDLLAAVFAGEPCAWPGTPPRLTGLSHGEVRHAMLHVADGRVDWPALAAFLTGLAPDLEGMVTDLLTGERWACVKGEVCLPDDAVFALRAVLPAGDAIGYGPQEAVLWRTTAVVRISGVTAGVLLPREVAIPAFTSCAGRVAIPSFRRPRAVLARARDPVVVPGMGTWVTLHGLGFVDIVGSRGLRVTVQRFDP